MRIPKLPELPPVPPALMPPVNDMPRPIPTDPRMPPLKPCPFCHPRVPDRELPVPGGFQFPVRLPPLMRPASCFEFPVSLNGLGVGGLGKCKLMGLGFVSPIN